MSEPLGEKVICERCGHVATFYIGFLPTGERNIYCLPCATGRMALALALYDQGILNPELMPRHLAASTWRKVEKATRRAAERFLLHRKS